MLRGHVPCDAGVQLSKDRQVLSHLRRIPCGPIREDEADARLGRERLLVRRSTQLTECFVEAFEADQRLREVRARGDVVGVHRDGLAQIRLGLGESLLLTQREAEIVERAELDRTVVERATQGGLRFAWMS